MPAAHRGGGDLQPAGDLRLGYVFGEPPGGGHPPLFGLLTLGLGMYLGHIDIIEHVEVNTTSGNRLTSIKEDL